MDAEYSVFVRVTMDRGRVVADEVAREVLVPGVLEGVYRVGVEVRAGGELRFSQKTMG